MYGQGAQEDPEERLGGPGRGKRGIQVVLRYPGRPFYISNPSIPDRGALDHFCCETCHKGPIGCKLSWMFCTSNPIIADRDALDHSCCETRYHTKAPSDANFLGGFAPRTQDSLIGVHLTSFAVRPITTRSVGDLRSRWASGPTLISPFRCLLYVPFKSTPYACEVWSRYQL